MSDGGALLDLQDVDLRLDQLRHRRTTRPELDELQRVESELATLSTADEADEASIAVLATEQRRLEDEVAGIEDKVARERDRESTMTSPRELQAVEAEIASLGRRQSDLEDRIIELMEQTEPLDEARSARAPVADGLHEQREALAAAIATARDAIDAEIDEVDGQRSSRVAAVDAAALRNYESLRERVGGIVVGRLDGATHTACSLQLPPTEVERLRAEPAGSVHPCECGLLIAMV